MKKESIYSEVLSMLNDRVDYKSITLAEVASRCGMGKSTIYEYFTSKDEMVYNSIIFYLGNMIKFFSESFEISSFRVSLKTFIKAVAITMKANFWMVLPWTFTDNYSGFLSDKDAKTIEKMLKKCKDVIYALFESLVSKGSEEGTLFATDDTRTRFAFNGMIATLCDEITPSYDLDTKEANMMLEDICSCIVKELN